MPCTLPQCSSPTASPAHSSMHDRMLLCWCKLIWEPHLCRLGACLLHTYAPKGGLGWCIKAAGLAQAYMQLTILNLSHHARAQQPDPYAGVAVDPDMHCSRLQVAVHPAKSMQLLDCLQPRGDRYHNTLLDTAQALGGASGCPMKVYCFC